MAPRTVSLTQGSTMALVYTMILILNAFGVSACDQKPSAAPVSAATGTTPVKIKGQTFNLEIAADEPVRMRGLGGRTSIPDDGGMIFAFPSSQWTVQNFVMRDCPIDIDIIYLDGAGRVLAAHEMKAQPRGEGDGQPGDWDVSRITDPKRRDGAIHYETRLVKYSSKFPATFAVELKAGSIKKLGVQEGDLLEFDVSGLKKRAK